MIVGPGAIVRAASGGGGGSTQAGTKFALPVTLSELERTAAPFRKVRGGAFVRERVGRGKSCAGVVIALA